MFLHILSEVEPSFKESYDKAANMAKEVAAYLAEQYTERSHKSKNWPGKNGCVT